jgi:hypothetical protein
MFTAITTAAAEAKRQERIAIREKAWQEGVRRRKQVRAKRDEIRGRNRGRVYDATLRKLACVRKFLRAQGFTWWRTYTETRVRGNACTKLYGLSGGTIARLCALMYTEFPDATVKRTKSWYGRVDGVRIVFEND